MEQTGVASQPMASAVGQSVGQSVGQPIQSGVAQVMGNLNECRDRAAVIADRLDVLEANLLGDRATTTEVAGSMRLETEGPQGFFGDAVRTLRQIAGSEERALGCLHRLETGTTSG